MAARAHAHQAVADMEQASVLTNEHNRTSRLLTPRIANATFVLLSVLLILAPNIVVGVVLGYKFDNVVAEANALDAELAALEAGWTGALDLQALTGLLARQQALSDEVTSTSRLAIALYAIYVRCSRRVCQASANRTRVQALTIVIILGVNFASVGLLNQIQSQIKFNTSLIASSGSRNHLNSGGSHRFAASAPPRVSLNEAVFVTIASEVHVDGTTSAIEPPPPVLKPAQETVPIPSLSKLRPPRPRRESAGGVAIQLAAMRKIKADLLTVRRAALVKATRSPSSQFVVAITLVGLTYLGLCIWLCCSWANLNTTWYWCVVAKGGHITRKLTCLRQDRDPRHAPSVDLPGRSLYSDVHLVAQHHQADARSVSRGRVVLCAGLARERRPGEDRLLARDGAFARRSQAEFSLLAELARAVAITESSCADNVDLKPVMSRAFGPKVPAQATLTARRVRSAATACWRRSGHRERLRELIPTENI